ncbi:DinB family protein [Ureibacillus aquaedulcis]|uniref:DinB family protein n=1 Tax=Ureibacillus aquaedulcis TaxID=3058421 RepID=A0ABT8GSJ2_9BACL|nr:DinB family protein [Ureibacillus sp. BA0131]MDN4494373.1 DinB family protein [Ureibacillus sp. BA0131]
MQINEKARQELFNEIDGISADNLNKKPSDDQWSIKQIVEHLYLMEGAIAKTIQGKLENGEVVNAEIKPIEAAINREVKIDAPKYTKPSNDFATLEELKKKLNMTHQKLLNIEEEADKEVLKVKGFPHPVFGQMSLKQWIPFVGYHEMRHILQIKEVKEKLGL